MHKKTLLAGAQSALPGLDIRVNFDTVQSTWPPSWISKKVLSNTYDVTNHVQLVNQLKENINCLT